MGWEIDSWWDFKVINDVFVEMGGFYLYVFNVKNYNDNNMYCVYNMLSVRFCVGCFIGFGVIII